MSWNTHAGAGDVERLVADLRAGRLTGQPVNVFALLLQEAVRIGAVVPAGPPPGSRFAHAPAADHPREDIDALAERLQLSVVYVPSMRNGRNQEDRGNAILCTMPIEDVRAIELPLERQRRVAIEATALVSTRTGHTLDVRLATTHFSNAVGHHLWVLSEAGRARQARALARSLDGDLPIIVGGDLNAWFGFLDASYRELGRRFPTPRPPDRRPTFGPMRLDHVLYKVPPTWRVSVRRLDSRYGSDHYPLLAQIDLPATFARGTRMASPLLSFP